MKNILKTITSVSIIAVFAIGFAVFGRVQNPLSKIGSEILSNQATYIVSTDSNTGDYTDIQSAIDALPSSGGKIFVKAGTYTLTSGIVINKDSVEIEGEGISTVISFNGSSISKAISNGASTTRYYYIKIKNLYITSTSNGNGTAIDMQYWSLSRISNIRSYGTNIGVDLNQTNTFYNSLDNLILSVSGSNAIGIRIGNGAHENTVFRVRVGSSGTKTNSTGVVVASAHSAGLYEVDVEGAFDIGYDIQANAHDTLISGMYNEGNAIGLKVAADVEALVLISGTIHDSTTYNIQNLGSKGLTFVNTRVQYEQFNYRESLNGFPSKRWIKPYFDSLVTTNQTFSSTTVLLSQFELENDAFLDGVSYVKGGTAVTTSTIMVGIYGPITTEETCSAAPLLVQASTTQSSGVNAEQNISLTQTLAKAGRYYVALASDNDTATYQRNPNQTQIVGWTQSMTKTGSAVSLSSTCSSPSNTGSAIPGIRVRAGTLTTY